MSKIIKDPLYGFIKLDNYFVNIINNPYFQRLRYIKQLGFAYMVYPTAEHSRFSHSLGVFYLTSIFVETFKNKLSILKDIERELLLASLLHDIGHGPFSHISEFALSKYLNVGHEEIGLKIIKENFDLEDIDFELFEELYKGKKIGKIIAGDVGVDRLDYLKRDSFFCGVEFGKVDNERIIKNIEYKEGDVEGEIILNEKALYDVYNLILSRYFMFKTVYFHKVCLLCDEIMKDIYDLLVNEENNDPEELMMKNDIELQYLILKSENKRIKELGERLFFRKIPKYKYRLKLSQLLSEKDLIRLKNMLREKEENTWVFQTNFKNIMKIPEIKVKSKGKLKDTPLIKSLIKEEKKGGEIFVYSTFPLFGESKENNKNFISFLEKEGFIE